MEGGKISCVKMSLIGLEKGGPDLVGESGLTAHGGTSLKIAHKKLNPPGSQACEERRQAWDSLASWIAKSALPRL